MDKRADLINTANSEIQTLEYKIKEYDKYFEQIRTQATHFDANYKDLLSKHESLIKELATLRKEEESWNSSLTKERQNSQYFSKELGKANSKIEDLIAETVHYRVEITKLQSEKESFEKPHSELQTKYEETAKLLKHLQLEYKHLQDENNSLKLENERIPIKSPSYSVNTDNPLHSGLQSDTTDHSSTEEPIQSNNSQPKKFSKKKKKSGSTPHKKSTNNGKH